MPRKSTVEIDQEVLHGIIEWIKGYRGSKDRNPYGIPEVKALLKNVAREFHIEDWMDADEVLEHHIRAQAQVQKGAL